MKKIVIFTGAGISAESGLKTFRDSNGLWEEYDVMKVATPEAWAENPQLVLEFYNKRRKQIYSAQPNEAHQALVHLEKEFNTWIITQNIDDLHERAGSKNILHLHGEISKGKSEINHDIIVDLKSDVINYGEKASDGYQLRPHVVWFGEEVPAMIEAYEIAKDADILIVIGTSLNVYPAADIVHYVPESCHKILIDPKAGEDMLHPHFDLIKKNASEGVPEVVNNLLK